MRSSAHVLAIFCFVLLAPDRLNAQDTASPSAVDAFVVGVQSLAKAASDPVDLGRAADRLVRVRSEITKSLLSAKSNNPLRAQIDLNYLVCDVRAAHIELAARRNYLQAVAGQVQKVGTPSKIDNLSSAIQALFAGQSLSVSSGIESSDDLDASRKNVLARCSRDFNDFDKAYYGRDVVAPQIEKGAGAPLPGLASFSAIGALVDTIVAVITPIVVEGTKIVDEQRRSAAVLKYLEDPNNIKKIQQAGSELSKAISAFTWEKRLRLAGSINEGAAVIRATQVDLDKDDSCKRYLQRGAAVDPDAKVPTDDFVLCWRFVWKLFESDVSNLLKAADDYDQISDVGDTDNAARAFDPLSKSLAAIKTTDATDLKKFWIWATNLIAFAQKVESGFSQENQDKVKTAIDKLVKTL